MSGHPTLSRYGGPRRAIHPGFSSSSSSSSFSSSPSHSTYPLRGRTTDPSRRSLPAHMMSSSPDTMSSSSAAAAAKTSPSSVLRNDVISDRKTASASRGRPPTTSSSTSLLQKSPSFTYSNHDRSRLSASVQATSNRDSDSYNSSSGFAHCHLKDLVRILHDIKPPTIVGKRINDANEVVELVSLPSKRVDEVYPGVFLGDYTVAESKSSLKNLNVTHVLNCAQGHGNHSVPTDEYFYKGTGMKFFGIPAVDHPGYDLSQYFHQAAEFINGCLNLGGRIFVHCVQGISRSSTIVCAYLMLKKSYSAVQALSCVRRKRNVCPNEGFLQQLVDLNNRLASKKDKSFGTNPASRAASVVNTNIDADIGKNSATLSERNPACQHATEEPDAACLVASKDVAACLDAACHDAASDGADADCDLHAAHPSQGVSYSSSFSSSRGKNPYLSYLESSPSSSSSSGAASSIGLTSSSSSSSRHASTPHRHSSSKSGVVKVAPATVAASPFAPKYNSLIGMIPMKTYTTAATAAATAAAGQGYNYRRYAI